MIPGRSESCIRGGPYLSNSCCALQLCHDPVGMPKRKSTVVFNSGDIRTVYAATVDQDQRGRRLPFSLDDNGVIAGIFENSLLQYRCCLLTGTRAGLTLATKRQSPIILRVARQLPEMHRSFPNAAFSTKRPIIGGNHP